MTSPSIHDQMLDAIEFFHYSQRFKNKLFTFLLGRAEYLREVLMDLRVLQSSHINALLCCRESRGLKQVLKEWLPRGYLFEHISFQSSDWESAVRASLQAERMPVLVFHGNEDKVFPPSRFHSEALNAAHALSSYKVFFLSKRRGLVVDNRFKSHPSPAEISEYLDSPHQINIGPEALSFFHKQLAASSVDLVLTEARHGALFQEIFTHSGSGTLFSIHHQDACRAAVLSDVRDISLLMTPYIQSGAVLPVSEDQIASEIENYHLAVVNGQIVATAKLSTYGESAEIAKLCTLPRYRGRGRARELVQQIAESARRTGKKSLFALTIDPKVAFLFKGLGFVESDRRDLPEAWQKNYDFSRPSRAFVLKL
ncbi:MAG: GNAT family N-acetyltransferase [Deltaproteobacteria bacterium]|nr:GNAT family N-acetyltransferase [Deltaproteobacteria bacterium]